MAKLYNHEVCPWKVTDGDLVLRKAEVSNQTRSRGKLELSWEGPYRMVEDITSHKSCWWHPIPRVEPLGVEPWPIMGPKELLGYQEMHPLKRTNQLSPPSDCLKMKCELQWTTTSKLIRAKKVKTYYDREGKKAHYGGSSRSAMVEKGRLATAKAQDLLRWRREEGSPRKSEIHYNREGKKAH
ncbi:hypothetical protein BHM03_00003388 [Ensete ventricosum]|nr:hypothetical protein BHM03_00003388 [Ensete ventricosum]